MRRQSLPPEQAIIESYYDRNPDYEWNRLARHRMELAITQKAIEAYGSAAPAAVLDCGGGPGRYAIWLAGLGYSVTLLDLSIENLRVAQAQAKDAGVNLTESVHGTATDLSQFPDNHFDMVLLLGPLYHLANQWEQLQALLEAKRVLKKGGVLFAAFLNRLALVRYIARFQPDLVLQDVDMIDSVLTNGDASSDKYPDAFSSFSTWAHPSEIEPMMEQSGLKKVTLFSAEGGLAYLDEGINELTGAEWDAWVNINYRLSKDRELLGSGIHLIYVGYK